MFTVSADRPDPRRCGLRLPPLMHRHRQCRCRSPSNPPPGRNSLGRPSQSASSDRTNLIVDHLAVCVGGVSDAISENLFSLVRDLSGKPGGKRLSGPRLARWKAPGKSAGRRSNGEYPTSSMSSPSSSESRLSSGGSKPKSSPAFSKPSPSSGLVIFDRLSRVLEELAAPNHGVLQRRSDGVVAHLIGDEEGR